MERLAEPEELLGTAKAYVRELAEQVAPTATAEIKRLVYDEAGMDIDTALIQAYDATNLVIHQPDAHEGATAYVDRRPPRFSRIGSKWPAFLRSAGCA